MAGLLIVVMLVVVVKMFGKIMAAVLVVVG